MNINEAALRKLSTRNRSKKEMEKFLKEKGFDNNQIMDCMDYLESYNYINDSRYVKDFLKYQLGKRKGISRIKIELKQKGISENDMEDGFYEYEEENSCDLAKIEEENAFIEGQKYLGDKEIILDKDLARLGRRLLSLGYKSNVAYKVVGKYMKESNYE